MECRVKKKSHVRSKGWTPLPANDIYYLMSLGNEEMDTESSMKKITVIGHITSIEFQKARLCAVRLYQHLPFNYVIPEICEMMQMEWLDYLPRLRRNVGGKTWILKRPVAVFINGEFIGSDIEFLELISNSYIFTIPTRIDYYESLIGSQYRKFIEKKNRKYAYLTFCMNGRNIGSFLFMLYTDLLPKTCDNFLRLCIGECRLTPEGNKLQYQNTIVHRIVKNGWIQCGAIDCVFAGGGCAANKGSIPDECFCIPHDRRGILSMANSGRNSNRSQFIVCLKPNPWMDHRYVAFGRLVDGANTLKVIENVQTHREKPLENIVITNCGEYYFEEEEKPVPLIQTVAEPRIILEKCYMDEEEEYRCISITSSTSDVLDVRDKPSILTAKDYLRGLYCLSTDYTPDMNLKLNALKEAAKEKLKKVEEGLEEYYEEAFKEVGENTDQEEKP